MHPDGWFIVAWVCGVLVGFVWFGFMAYRIESQCGSQAGAGVLMLIFCWPLTLLVVVFLLAPFLAAAWVGYFIRRQINTEKSHD